VNHDSAILSGATEFEVTVNGVEGALCAISHDGVLLGHAYTDITGVALITFDDPIEDIEEVDLVVTLFNSMPYMTILDVTPPLRNIAEFEPMQGVLIRYPFGISYDVIAEMAEDDTVLTIVANPSEEAYVESQYATHGVNTSNTEYLIAPTDSYWTRDYGPWYRYNSTINEIEVVDFEYNRPRPDDDNIPNVLANYYGLNSVYMDLITAGGNYMTDGMGISVSTELVLTENPSKTEMEIKELVRDYLGISKYHIYPDPLGEYIEHVDCWGKYLSPDTIMIIEVSPSHGQYDDIEAAATYFSNQISSYGTPYTVVRVYCHLDEPYVNSLILNDKVLVPITGSPYDSAALTSYEDAMPGYEVIGFTGSWQNTDALHCRSKGIPDFDMVRIDHEKLIDQMPNDAGFVVTAEMLSYSDYP
jgi:agmatine/peptidylarginine deiminase